MVSKAQKLADEATAASASFEWETFSVSSSFPREVFAREEEVAGFFLPGRFTSLKNAVNAELASEITSKTGKKNAQRFPEAIFEFDFLLGKAWARAAPLYLFGHYLKLSRSHCQSRWHCSSCGGKGCQECGGSGRNYPSVEDEIGSVALEFFGASEAILHASGREDVDVRCLGNGRPFVLELKNPKKRRADIGALEAALAKNKDVRAVGLRLVGPAAVDAVCNSHFDKEYHATVSADRPLGEADAKAAELLSGSLILQQTPMRVLSRRSDLKRKRKIFKIKAECAPNGKLRLSIFAEAGTYIKEFINSDSGRTRPSLSEALGCNAACDELDVAFIHDYFLETLAY